VAVAVMVVVITALPAAAADAVYRLLAFSALTPLVGQQEGHPASEKHLSVEEYISPTTF